MEFTITITGTAPLLVHNGRLADPLDPAAKALKEATASRRKTDEDHEQISRLEFAGGLYHDPTIGPYMPGDNIWRALYDSAKKSRQGPSVKEGVIITTDVNPLAYQGPRDVEKLYADSNFVHRVTVRNQTNRVVRTRPMFRQWRCDAHGFLDDTLLNFRDLQIIAERAGMLIGLGDWRPRYGRFTAEISAA